MKTRTANTSAPPLAWRRLTQQFEPRLAWVAQAHGRGADDVRPEGGERSQPRASDLSWPLSEAGDDQPAPCVHGGLRPGPWGGSLFNLDRPAPGLRDSVLRRGDRATRQLAGRGLVRRGSNGKRCASAGRTSDDLRVRLMPGSDRENDVGRRFTIRPPSDSQRQDWRSLCASCGCAWCCPVAGDAPGVPTGMGATPPVDALVMAWAGAGFRNPEPAPGGSLPVQ